MDHVGESRFHTTFIEVTDNLESKHFVQRKKGIETLSNTLKNHFAFSDLITQKETIVELLLKGVGRGEDQEIGMAAEVIGLVFITLGTDAEDLRARTIEGLKKGLARSTPSNRTKGKILEVMSMVEFITADSVETMESIEFIGDFFSDQNSDPILVGAAISSWSFLVTSVEPETVISELIPRFLFDLSEFLYLENHELRLASGESLSILIDLCRNTEDFHVSLWDGYCSVSSIVDTLDMLSNESTHSFSKKELKAQRRTFREYSAIISETTRCSDSLKCGRQVLEFDGAEKVKQLDGFRSFLGSGLIRHFTKNTFLYDVFGSKFLEDEPLVSVRERTIEKSTRKFNDKTQTLEKRAKVKSRGAQTAFGDDDDD